MSLKTGEVRYADPPVVETVLGVEFDPVQELRLLHYGLFWAEIHEDYPNYELRDEAASVVDSFGRSAPVKEDLRVQLLPEPRFRFWFKDLTESKLLQIQADRFIKNWRKKEGANYPKYPLLRDEFVAEWTRYREFLKRQNVIDIRIRQTEVSYVNQIPQGYGWRSLADLNKLLNLPGFASIDSLNTPSGLSFQTSYVDSQKARRVSFDVKHAVRKSDLVELIQFTISVRGRPASSENVDVLGWMDDARTLANTVFSDVTTQDARRIWEGGMP
jgi:uncharacterized protein (TIGR04255 family)